MAFALLTTATAQVTAVIAVADSDTLTVLDGGRPVRIRFAGVDTPEKAQAQGARSTASLSEFFFRKDAHYRSVDVDCYGAPSRRSPAPALTSTTHRCSGEWPGRTPDTAGIQACSGVQQLPAAPASDYEVMMIRSHRRNFAASDAVTRICALIRDPETGWLPFSLANRPSRCKKSLLLSLPATRLHPVPGRRPHRCQRGLGLVVEARRDTAELVVVQQVNARRAGKLART